MNKLKVKQGKDHYKATISKSIAKFFKKVTIGLLVTNYLLPWLCIGYRSYLECS
jgi:hypothetical protein